MTLWYSAVRHLVILNNITSLNKQWNGPDELANLPVCQVNRASWNQLHGAHFELQKGQGAKEKGQGVDF